MTNHLIAHLAHVELLTPKLSETLWFFTDLLSMYVVKKEDRSVYLRAWGELDRSFSLRITEADRPGLGHVSWRAESADDLEKAVSILKSNNVLGGSHDSEFGVGNAYHFTSPDDHKNEIFWEMKKEPLRPELRSKINARPMKMPGKIMAVRRLDHCTFFSSDVESSRKFYQGLGFKYNEGIVSSLEKRETGAFLTVTGQSHDLGILRDLTGARGRLNHVAFLASNVGTWIEGCDMFVENGIPIEMGPMRHGITDSLGLYVIEPGGNRVEIFQDAYVNYTPASDWNPIITDVDSEEGKYSSAWGVGFLVETWLTYGTPFVPIPESAREIMTRMKKRSLPNVYKTFDIDGSEAR